MTSQELFIELLHRLRKRGDASVLYILLRNGADEREYKTNTTAIATATGVSRQQVHRAFRRLEEGGLIKVLAQQSYRTCITVDRDAVMQMLSQPRQENLPGTVNEMFPLLLQIPESAH